MPVLTPAQYQEIKDKRDECERVIHRYSTGPDPNDPDKQDNPIAIEALTSSCKAMIRMYQKMIDQHVAESPAEDLA